TSRPHDSPKNAQELPHKPRLEVAGRLDPRDTMDVYQIPLDPSFVSLQVRLWSQFGSLGVAKRMWLLDQSGTALGSWAFDNTTQLTMLNLASLSQANRQALYLGITSTGLLAIPADTYFLELTFQTQTDS